MSSAKKYIHTFLFSLCFVLMFTVTAFADETYDAVSCVGVPFELSVQSGVDQDYTLTCDSDPSFKYYLSGSSSISSGSWGQYIKTYTGTINISGDHTVTIAGTVSSPLTCLVQIKNHSISDSWEIIPATCTTNGSKVRKCTLCGKIMESQIIEATGHTPGVWEKESDLTCVTDEAEVLKCTVCGQEIDRKVITAAPGHTYEWVIFSEPSCISTGCRYEKCSVCGAIGKTEDIPMVDHKYEWDIISEPTCVSAGYRYEKCSVCGLYGNSESIPATGHKYQLFIDKQETCSTTGSQHEECILCHDRTAPVTIPANGKHNYITITDEATCGAHGMQYKECIICGTRQTPIMLPATGKHSFGPWVTTVSPTYTHVGTRKRTCKVCGTSESEDIPILVRQETPATETPTTEAPETENPTTETPATEVPVKPSVPAVKPILKLNVGSSIPMQVKKTFSGVKASKILRGDKITKWKSSNTKVAAVSRKGKITAKATGKTTITATTKKGAKASFKVIVRKSTVVTKKFALNRKTVVLKTKGASKTFQISVTRNPITATDKITYKSSNPRIVTVSSKGKLTAKKSGKATIAVKCGKKTATLKVTVKK